MRYYYEMIEHQDDLPIRLFVNSVEHIPFHWHKELELIYVLQGTIVVHVDQKQYELKQNGIIAINSMAVHQIERTNQDNVLLTLQFNPELLGETPHLQCVSPEPDKERSSQAFDLLRRDLARMAWESSKKSPGYRSFAMGSLQRLAGCLQRYFSTEGPGSKEAKEYDYRRLSRVLQYIDRHYSQKITLQTMADREHLSLHYFSHFFSDKIGVPFQKYLTAVRLDKAASALLETGKSMTEIALDCGFANVKLFNKYFKEKYHCTPSSYRDMAFKAKTGHGERKPLTYEESSSGDYYETDTIQAMESLYRYLDPDDARNAAYSDVLVPEAAAGENVMLSIDARAEGVAYTPHWNKVTTAGRAVEGLRYDWRKQFAELQRELRFSHIRFHGIFNDEMMVYQEHENGEPLYNWAYVDKLYDFLLEHGVRPFVELGFMPTLLRRSSETIFWWRGNISPPADQQKWNALVRAFVGHCMNRYGVSEVRSWYFEVWNEPDLSGVCWAGTKEEYFKFYEDTARTIKDVDSQLTVGGPALGYGSLWNDSWGEEFIAYCRDRDVPLDFFSFHVYSEYPHRKDEPEKLTRIMPPDYYRESVVRLRSMIGMDRSSSLKLYMTEWNFSLYDRNLIHDTMFMAPFVIRNALDTSGLMDGIAFWSFTDVFEESVVPPSPFYGGFGLMNRDGLKKPSYYGLKLLGKLGGWILAKGEGYVATKNAEGGIQLLLYHYAHVDKLFASGDWTGLSELNRYSVFEEKGNKEVTVQVEGIMGHYRVRKYELNRRCGSVFDEWVKLGAPVHPSEEELAYLGGRSGPEMSVSEINADGSCRFNCTLPPHGVALYMVDPIFDEQQR